MSAPRRKRARVSSVIDIPPLPWARVLPQVAHLDAPPAAALAYDRLQQTGEQQAGHRNSIAESLQAGDYHGGPLPASTASSRATRHAEQGDKMRLQYRTKPAPDGPAGHQMRIPAASGGYTEAGKTNQIKPPALPQRKPDDIARAHSPGHRAGLRQRESTPQQRAGRLTNGSTLREIKGR